MHWIQTSQRLNSWLKKNALSLFIPCPSFCSSLLSSANSAFLLSPRSLHLSAVLLSSLHISLRLPFLHLHPCFTAASLAVFVSQNPIFSSLHCPPLSPSTTAPCMHLLLKYTFGLAKDWTKIHTILLSILITRNKQKILDKSTQFPWQQLINVLYTVCVTHLNKSSRHSVVYPANMLHPQRFHTAEEYTSACI